MGKRQQKKYNASFKAQVALAAIQNQMTVSEIIEKFGVSKTIIYKWKEEFLSKSATVFEKTIYTARLESWRWHWILQSGHPKHWG